MSYFARCLTCRTLLAWTDGSSGGRWQHDQHQDDTHTALPFPAVGTRIGAAAALIDDILAKETDRHRANALRSALLALATAEFAITADGTFVPPTEDAQDGACGSTAGAPGQLRDPDSAYEQAPSLLREMFDVMEVGLDAGMPEDSLRPYRVRRAALLDRIALHESETCPPAVAGEAADAAEIAAWGLAATDHEDGFLVPPWAQERPRDYVRREYARYRLGDCVCDLFDDGPCPTHPHPDR
ncbi:hypothetical protein [Streptomyces triculaminicus]|uniref:hypothetical protein n=1 Tax=Streptomyces triculaminicus TaxID=2816232 RepID=UPI0037D2B266